MSRSSCANKTATLHSTDVLYCVCVCVCERERGGEGGGERERERRRIIETVQATEGLKYVPRGPHFGHPCPTVQYTTPHYPAYYSHSQQSLSHQIHRALWDRKVHWRVHKSPLLVCIHRETNSVHALLPRLRCVLILPYHPKFHFTSGLFPSALDSAALVYYTFRSQRTTPTEMIILKLVLKRWGVRVWPGVQLAAASGSTKTGKLLAEGGCCMHSARQEP
jgi:hypothetical protein